MTKEELKEFCKMILGGDIPTTVIDEDKPLRSAEHPTMKPIPPYRQAGDKQQPQG